MKNKLEKLEAIRGLAALYVVFHHSFFSDSFKIFNINFAFLFKFGQEAVILFFLMSGFVIGYSFENSRDKSFWSYFQKRFYRIFIPLIIVFITHYAIKCFQSGGFFPVNWTQLIGNLFMLQDVGALKPNVIVEPFLGNSPLWSLSYEWWFYMSFFLFYILFAKFRYKDISVCILVIVSAITYIWYPNFINRLFMYYGIWWVGVEMARSYLNHSTVRFKDLKVSFIYLFATCGILTLNAFLHKKQITTIGVSPMLELRHYGFTLAIIVLALIWQKLNWVLFDQVIGKFSLLAPLSYVLYISHYFLVVQATYLSFLQNKYLTFFIYLGVTLLYSYLVEVVIFPFLRSKLYSPKKQAFSPA
jgi:peptidoglycan/LPS O-acetylase OafA/YrhL